MKQQGSTVLNPIYHWTDKDVWDFIKQEHICTNSLYECGYKRVGCIGCPLATYKGRLKEFADYPQFKKAYINSFVQMLKVREQRGLESKWKTGQEVFDWWIEEYKHNVKGQMTLDDFMK